MAISATLAHFGLSYFWAVILLAAPARFLHVSSSERLRDPYEHV
jgi:hypothetical protein